MCQVITWVSRVSALVWARSVLAIGLALSVPCSSETRDEADDASAHCRDDGGRMALEK